MGIDVKKIRLGCLRYNRRRESIVDRRRLHSAYLVPVVVYTSHAGKTIFATSTSSNVQPAIT
jgi:hypothetical protein